jgi:cytidine deaminase
MEVQIAPDKGGMKAFSKVIWHIEDDTRVSVALCGRTLHEVCKSVSPALAMLGKPCPACKDIVKEYLKAKTQTTLAERMSGLIMNDLPFRGNVHRIVPPAYFNVNLE